MYRVARIVYSSSWSRRKQVEMLDEWNSMAPASTPLGVIRKIAANCERHRYYGRAGDVKH